MDISEFGLVSAASRYRSVANSCGNCKERPVSGAVLMRPSLFRRVTRRMLVTHVPGQHIGSNVRDEDYLALEEGTYMLKQSMNIHSVTWRNSKGLN